ncbi:MAG: hypothetical protein MUO42_09545, partial [Anaerolineaceae bacterium]|nr:hypothetical protein [Anaerolineaceae bacterium]
VSVMIVKLHAVRIKYITNPTHNNDFLKRIIYASFLKNRFRKIQDKEAASLQLNADNTCP